MCHPWHDTGATCWPTCCTPRTVGTVPNHQENQHEILRLGWSFPHWRNAAADVQESQTSQFCWACESRRETRCSDPTASREEQPLLSSAGGKGRVEGTTDTGRDVTWRDLWRPSHQFLIQMNPTDFKVKHEQLCYSPTQTETNQSSLVDTASGTVSSYWQGADCRKNWDRHKRGQFSFLRYDITELPACRLFAESCICSGCDLNPMTSVLVILQVMGLVQHLNVYGSILQAWMCTRDENILRCDQ